MLEAVTEFISFLTNHSVEEHMANDNRKTFVDSDLIKSLNDLDFQIFVPPLQAYLSQRQEKPIRATKSQTDKNNENDTNSAELEKDPADLNDNENDNDMDVDL